MLTSLIVTAAGVVGSGAGIYIAAMFVPTFAALLKSTLDFLRSPVGMIAGAMVGAFLLYSAGWVGGDIHGTNKTRTAWRAARVAAEKAWTIREAVIRRDMRAEADSRLAAIGKDEKSIDVKEKRYEDSTVGPAYPATADDIKRLYYGIR
jgi:hypothetical protein